MQQIKISELKSHPRNDEFFDNIVGENWDAFLESIRTSGVIEPVIVTQDKTIVSGHQRVRGCEELGIDTVNCEIRIYDNEDKILKDLLETNIRQRGIGNTNPIKMGRCIIELERIYGIAHGGNRKSNPNYSDLKNLSQKDLANIVGISVDTLNNYKKLTTLIPELEDLVDTGVVTPTTALSIIKCMSTDEQEKLVLSMDDTTRKITQKQIQQYIDQIKYLKSRQPEIVEIEKVVEKVIDNTDFSSIERNKKLNEELEKIKKENCDLQSTNRLLEMSKKSSENLSESYKKLSEEYMAIKSKIIDMGLEPDGEYNLYSAAGEIAKLTKEIEDLLLNKLAPIRYENFMIAVKSSDVLRKNFKNTLDMVNDWYLSMNEYIYDNVNQNNNNNNVIDMDEM